MGAADGPKLILASRHLATGKVARGFGIRCRELALASTQPRRAPSKGALHVRVLKRLFIALSLN